MITKMITMITLLLFTSLFSFCSPELGGELKIEDLLHLNVAVTQTSDQSHLKEAEEIWGSLAGIFPNHNIELKLNWRNWTSHLETTGFNAQIFNGKMICFHINGNRSSCGYPSYIGEGEVEVNNFLSGVHHFSIHDGENGPQLAHGTFLVTREGVVRIFLLILHPNQQRETWTIFAPAGGEIDAPTSRIHARKLLSSFPQRLLTLLPLPA